MNKVLTAIFIKPEVTFEDLKKYGFRQSDTGFVYWKPNFVCAEYEKSYYNDEDDYAVHVIDRQLIIYPNGWQQISAKIQTLLFDMIVDGVVEKRSLIVKEY